MNIPKYKTHTNDAGHIPTLDELKEMFHNGNGFSDPDIHRKADTESGALGNIHSREFWASLSEDEQEQFVFLMSKGNQETGRLLSAGVSLFISQ